MEVKIIDLLKSKNAMNALNQITFKAIYGMKINKIVKAVNAELENFQDEYDKKVKILREGLAEDEMPSEEMANTFNEEMDEASAAIVNLPNDKMKFSWFAKTNGAINEHTEWHDFSPSHFQTLDWLINDDIG